MPDRFCVSCGAALGQDARFCAACGAAVPSTGQPPYQPAGQPPYQGAGQPPYQPAGPPQYQPPFQPQYPPAVRTGQAGARRSVPAGVLALAAAVVLIGCMVANRLYYFSNPLADFPAFYRAEYLTFDLAYPVTVLLLLAGGVLALVGVRAAAFVLAAATLVLPLANTVFQIGTRLLNGSFDCASTTDPCATNNPFSFLTISTYWLSDGVVPAVAALATVVAFLAGRRR